MIKKAKLDSSSETKKTYMGVRLLFVIIWLMLVALLTNTDFLRSLLEQSNTENDNLIIDIILLIPIAIVIFPLAYRIEDIYNTSEKRVPIPAWKRSVFGVVGTSIILGLVLYLFTIISVALFYRF